MTIRAGLCSVTFRSHPWREVLSAASSAGATVIEWGGDVHVPNGDQEHALAVGRATRSLAIEPSSYGSYFRAGDATQDLRLALVSASGLGSTRLRVWAGRTASDATTRSERARIVKSLQETADTAALLNIEVGLEYHGGTLTDTASSTMSLLDDVDRPNVRTYWQPPVGMETDEALADLRTLLERVCALHVFSWWPSTERVPLSSREALWRGALDTLSETGRDFDAFLEFVPGDEISLLHSELAQLTLWAT